MKIIFRTLLLAALVSCQIVEDTPPEEQNIFNIDELEKTCEIDVNRFSLLLDEDITPAINCFSESLDRFSKFVRRDNQNIIRRVELEQFIRKFFVSQQDEIIGSLKVTFQLTHLILKDEKDVLTVSRIESLVRILKLVNSRGRNISDMFKGIDKDNYWSQRATIERKFDLLADEIIYLLNDIRGENNEVDIMNIARDMKDAFDLPDSRLDLELIRSFLYLKRLFFGGNKEKLNNFELIEILRKAPNILMLVFDGIYIDNKPGINETSKYRDFITLINRLENLFYTFDTFTEIADHEDVLNSVQEVIGYKYNLENMKDSIYHLKGVLVGGSEDLYTFGDLQVLVGLGRDLLEKMYFNLDTYDYFKDDMLSPSAISNLPKPSLKSHSYLIENSPDDLWEEFLYITKNYRFFQHEDKLQHYVDEYRRSEHGFGSITMWRWVIEKLVHNYGHIGLTKDPGIRFGINGAELKYLLVQLRPMLEELNFWPADLNRLVNEAVSSADLFQFMSNGDNNINVDEAVEYVILSSNVIADQMIDIFKNYCDYQDEEDPAFEVECYRENVFKILFEDLKHTRQFAKLNQFVKRASKNVLYEFNKNVELYAREIYDDSIPIGKSDLSRLLVSFSNIEGTFVRYDRNKSNILERKELDNALKTFSPTISSFLPKAVTIIGGIVRSVFLFLVDKMVLPSVKDLIIFHLFKKKDKINSGRLNISTIIAFFSNTTTENHLKYIDAALVRAHDEVQDEEPLPRPLK